MTDDPQDDDRPWQERSAWMMPRGAVQDGAKTRVHPAHLYAQIWSVLQQYLGSKDLDVQEEGKDLLAKPLRRFHISGFPKPQSKPPGRPTAQDGDATFISSDKKLLLKFKEVHGRFPKSGDKRGGELWTMAPDAGGSDATDDNRESTIKRLERRIRDLKKAGF